MSKSRWTGTLIIILLWFQFFLRSLLQRHSTFFANENNVFLMQSIEVQGVVSANISVGIFSQANPDQLTGTSARPRT